LRGEKTNPFLLFHACENQSDDGYNCHDKDENKENCKPGSDRIIVVNSSIAPKGPGSGNLTSRCKASTYIWLIKLLGY
jgi:hypothetical protein